MSLESKIGNLAELKEGDVLLPNYLLSQEDGIYVNLSLFPVGGEFDTFIDRLFGDGYRFVQLNYQLLMNLLFDYDVILDTYGIDTKVKLAKDIVSFPPRRKKLYRATKTDSYFESTEYFFEPVEIEVEIEIPVYGEETGDGVRPIVGTERISEFKPTTLDVDEFIADMWLKGVRFGIAVDEVAGVILRKASVRMIVATQLDATTGTDAEIEEASDVLRRDNSPKILPNGKADLRKFQNRFPQVEVGTLLLKKKPRSLGKPGYKVNGARIEPEIPNELDLQKLAGIGTRIETHDGYEFIVSARKGFLALDVETNHIQITEKIENKTGVSLKTTGDLSLEGKDFIEHGEVQEGRIVQGTNMTFRSEVYGAVVSKGGFILLEQNLSNGSAKSLGGDVTSNGRAFNSNIEAREGRIVINYAEACLILGKSVVIDQAINCDIVAEDIVIGTAEGCGIAGKSIKITSSRDSRGNETNISLVLPDLTVIETQIRQVNKAIQNCQQIISTKENEVVQISSSGEVAKYLAVAASVKKSTVKLSAAHQENWKKMTDKFAKVDSALVMLNGDIQDQLKRIQSFKQEIVYLVEGRENTGKGIQCQIAEVVGDTLVRTMSVYNGIIGLHRMVPVELKGKLREQASLNEKIFFEDEGSLDWKFKLPEILQ
jgi:hypothetical protein